MLRNLTILVALTFQMTTTHAQANSLINNSASGVVNGSIIQEASGSNAGAAPNARIDIGSIITNGQSVNNVNVSAYVNGDIVTQGSNTHISIGSFYGNQ